MTGYDPYGGKGSGYYPYDGKGSGYYPYDGKGSGYTSPGIPLPPFAGSKSSPYAGKGNGYGLGGTAPGGQAMDADALRDIARTMRNSQDPRDESAPLLSAWRSPFSSQLDTATGLGTSLQAAAQSLLTFCGAMHEDTAQVPDQLEAYADHKQEFDSASASSIGDLINTVNQSVARTRGGAR